jgi:hypothetical protein
MMQISGIISAVLRGIGKVLQPRLTALEKRIEELERHPFSFSGVWESGQYERNEFVSHRGSLWFSHTQTTSKPGTDNDWQLVVKHGRNGRDGKDFTK